jgi:spermidine synthase
VTRPWEVLDRVPTAGGALELRRRAPDDYLVTLAGRVLMNSVASRSERALAELACAELQGRRRPRLLIGGLGMGCTLRAALDALPEGARLIVAELHEAVARWCRGPLAQQSGSALDDPRVSLRIGDVMGLVDEAASRGGKRFDAILLDLFEGPGTPAQLREHPQYGVVALMRTRAALRDDGVLAVWCEDRAPAFEKSLRKAGFSVRHERPGRGGRRHAVYLARPETEGRRSRNAPRARSRVRPD